MARINRLNDRQIRSLVTQGEPRFLGDGNGLYLRVTGSGSASWFFRVKANGKILQKGIGPLSGRSLAAARKVAGDMMAAVTEGRDPATVLKPKLDPIVLTFKDYAADFIAGKAGEHKSVKAHAQWTSTIAAYCGQIAGKRPAEITYRDVELLVGQPALKGKRETAARVLQRVRVILDYAAKREGEPGRFNPAVAVRLPKRQPGEVKHHAAAPYQDVPTIMAALREKDSMSALVLRFSIATAARSGNVRNAEWDEIDSDEAVWNIPAHKMKGGLAFRQPLNAEALEVLALVKDRGGVSRRCFPGPNGGLISDVAINKTLHSIYPGVTVHGTARSSFRQWGAEQTQYSHEALELCLAHVQKDRVVAAYQRSDLLEIRKQVLASWANYIGGRNNVIELVSSK